MRNSTLILLAVLVICGCSHSSPVDPETNADVSNRTITDSDNHYLWGEWNFLINNTHDEIEVVPKREGRFHLNALKFLEESCTDCLEITSIQNNGDSTVDVTVQIKHPFTGFPEYTGFDVKGIVMFDGSWTHPGYEYYLPWPEPMRVSWRKLGDPQRTNPDGYTLRWSPSYDSGSDLPIYKYWEGKYASGTPTANINGYLDFYTDEERHMFSHWGVVSRTYTIWLPPGEAVTIGYAVEACWAPPTNTPVVDPITDFPPEANQEEAYEFKLWLENDGVITHADCCGDSFDPTEAYYIKKQWGGNTARHYVDFTDYTEGGGGGVRSQCGDEWPEYWFCGPTIYVSEMADGDYIGVAINYKLDFSGDPWRTQMAYTVFEFTIDLE